MRVQWHRIFAYGSNMNLADLSRWFDQHSEGDPVIRSVVPAVLPDYQLVWNYRSQVRRNGAANIERVRGSLLPGVVLEVDDVTRSGLDRKEGHPHRYSRGNRREVLWTLDGHQEIRAWVYRVRPSFRQQKPVWPSRGYLQLLIDAARAHRLPSAHILALAQTPVADSQTDTTIE